MVESLCLTYSMTHAAEIIHKRVFSRILRAPMSFFDTTPLGRITNRLSKDIDNTDLQIPQAFRMFFMLSAWTLASLILMSLSGWEVLIGLFALLILFFLVQVGIFLNIAMHQYLLISLRFYQNFLKKTPVEYSLSNLIFSLSNSSGYI